MGTVSRKVLRGLQVAWFWLAVLLVLPHCGFSGSGPASPPPNLNRGDEPRAAVLFCDIEMVRRCATAADKAAGVRLAAAGILFVEGRGNVSMIGLDDSAAALGRCMGEPEAIEYRGPFPQGLPFCMNCATLTNPAVYADANAACRAACYDELGGGVDDLGNRLYENPPTDAVKTYCDANARASLNYPLNGCFDGSCVNDVPFTDRRVFPEVVEWRDPFNVTLLDGGSVTRAPQPPPTGNFDAGAASTQLITRGDAYVEFAVSRTDQFVAVGLSEAPVGCTTSDSCPDQDPSLADMSFAFLLGNDGRISLWVRGAFLPGPEPDQSWGAYAANERFRVAVRDNGNGFATVSFIRVAAGCAIATPCAQTVLYTHMTSAARYPMRVNASIRDVGVVVSNVQLARIK